jgi:hypothetical protein
MPKTPAQDTCVLEALRARTDAYRAAYADSPAAGYVRARGIPDAIAARLGWGYAGDGFEGGYMNRHRLFIPLENPAGTVTGGTGRALDSTTKPKYLTLRNDDGYRKTLVYGRAIAEARANRAPLVICEGPFDAAACLAGGIRYVIALNGVTVAPVWLAGIPRVFMATDDDDAGRAAVDRLRRSVPVHIETWEEGDLSGCKDVAEHWHEVQRLPAALRIMAADQAHPQLTDAQRTEALELAFSMLCDSVGSWERETRAALADPETTGEDREMIRYALAVYEH